MTERDKSILEYSEKMCEYCSNFDKEHTGMDGMALCKLTMTLAYAEDYGGNCMFYNVPKEQIIVPPCKVGDTVYDITDFLGGVPSPEMYEIKDNEITIQKTMSGECVFIYNGIEIFPDEIGKFFFLTKEEAEKALKEKRE